VEQSLLEGIRVLDLTQYAPGPYATRLLCDLGAEVIKIEAPNGDRMRGMFHTGPELLSPIYQFLNKGKQIARLNLKDKSVVRNLEPLIKSADVLLESFRPGVMNRFGLSETRCHQLNPGLVYCSLTGYGQDGPSLNAAGHDINYCAAAGFLSFIEDPKPMFPLVADHSGSMNAVNAILAALVSRLKTGQGSYLDISLYEAILGWQYPVIINLQNQDNTELCLLSGGAACYNIYQTLDGRHVTLGALEEKFWANFCQALGKTDWISRQYETYPQQALIDQVRSLIENDTLANWCKLFEKVDCCFEPIPLPSEIFDHPQTAARGLTQNYSMAYPGKIDHQSCRNDNTLQDLEPTQIPKWREQ
jgi:crotonobetainyl-CoA:carnitine CoA-transferase CaiB-like acyl-CoA transferase